MEDKAPEIPRLSQGIAKVVLTKSLAHAFAKHRLGGNERPDPTDAMNRGKAIEAMLTGGDLKDFEVIPFDDFRKADAKKARDAAIALGKTVVKKKDWDEWMVDLDKMKVAIKEACAPHGIMFQGQDQVRFEWESNGCPCSGVADKVDWDNLIIWDLKITENAAPSKVCKQVIDMGYDVQGVSYIEAAEIQLEETRGRWRFLDLHVEPAKPFGVTITELAGSAEELAQEKWDRAKRMWKRGLANGFKEVYPPEIYRVEAKMWHMDQEADASLVDETQDERFKNAHKLYAPGEK